MTLDYFYGQAGKLFSFYRIPKALFQEQRFQNLSTDAKTLYGILLDRMSLSVKNEWFDKQGRVFIIFTIEDVKRALCCADNKATKLLRELENFGLIERKRRGLGKPSLVYVKNFSSDLSNERVQNRENHESGSPIIPSQRGCWPMPKNGLNVSLNSYDDIFSTEETRQEEQREQVQQIPIDELYPFKDHPFKVLDDEAMQRTVESIKQLGVTNPLIARPRPDGGYEIISGHRRQHAAQLARLKTLPVIVRDMSDDAAVLLMVDSNLQREQILPSERAFAYKMKLDALKRQGARSDLTSSQVGMKLQALDIVGQEAGDSRNQVHRFIRLTNLIPELLDMVDEKKISFNPAVELSYLDESQQRDFLEAMADTQNAPSLSQAQRLKKLAQEGHFSYDVAFAVMGEPKKDELDKVVIKNDTLRKYFPESSTPREMEEKIIGLLEESKTEKVVFRSDSIKKYFPSNYSSEQIENSILKMLDQRMKKRKHEAER